MEMTVFITLLEIQVTVVALVDCSGFMDWLKGKIGRWLGVKGDISLKPLDCSLCMTHWTGLAWLVCSGKTTLTAYMTLCPLALLTVVTRRLAAFVIYGLTKMIDYVEGKI